ncbi:MULTISPECIES: aldehyde dehydrogenase family protein [Burkholderiaceae]|uniref:Betaine-aldehyde dehydrogenase n=1 Tax=Caballeronia zhejiangensis TaxID=871203 RepID=A0A656QAW6_9BURK|nr:MULTISPECIES: aldehyde dehydrogenase family protein [Burkholderiaceae]KAK43554.1 betaine-aldehyde dehydrogenase [Caballeronia jiangsuensis]KDR26091.1 betaine-aldehyde dehydrogenase [Caballeronia zhejiangensis]KWU24277.1 betaine aldehyde dehydrogenase [Burkholderia cenocepacia]SAL77612.1 betaine-aldehyde dehydrogenase [Caballeronia peredens]
MQTQLFIDGNFVPSLSGETLATLNPHDNTVIADIAMANHADIDRAVTAAKAAYPAWKNMAAADRGRLLLKLADAIEANADRLAQLESIDTGHPIRDTRFLDVPRTAATFRYFGGMADKFEGSVIPVDAGFLNYLTREPVGIVGQVVPWNFPLMFTSWKMAPALAAGNCVVMKPAELTPLSSLAIAELMAEVGFPKGVVNILPGLGHIAGQYIAEHPEISKVAFTGSTAVGRKVVQASSGNLKKVQLELGGKGANIVFADANIAAVVQGSAFGIFHNQGQACIAASRMIVHESVADEVLEKFVALTRSIKLGNPLDPKTEMGPLTSLQHRDRVLSYVDIAREQGGDVLTGGKTPDGEGFAKGCYVEPTIVHAKPTDRVSQEEVFGPFMTVTTFRTDEEALAIANGTEYGLGAGLWTRDLQRAHQMAREIRSGMVWINCYKRVSPGSPFGGVGASGYGREMGFEVMREYTQAKSVWVNVDAKIPPYFPR